MIKKLREKREELKSRGSAGFTLMELIIVIAILAMLIGMLLPRFANYTDKAMGTAAGVDTKNILTVGAAYNLDNIKQIDLAELQKETGLNGTGVGGKTLTQTGTDKAKFTYTYIRGGAKIVATIDLQNSTITYMVTGTDSSTFDSTKLSTTTLDNTKQAHRIAKGLGF